MAAQYPGHRIAAKEASELHTSVLDSPDITRALTALYEIFSTSFGPGGHAKLLHNNCGGQVTLTTSSSRIHSALSVSKSVVKLICSALLDHLKVYSDGASLAAILSLQLILKALELKIHKRLIIEIYELLLGVCLEYLQSDDCPFKMRFDFQSSDEMKKLIRNIYRSKPACLLFELDLEYICGLTLETFLKTYQTEKESQINKSNLLLYVTLEGKPVRDSELFEGILYQTPQIPTYRKNPLELKTFNGEIKVALVETSMAGDSDSFLDVNYETTSDLSLSDTVLSQLLQFTGAVVDYGIGLLGCQRVVHPKVKRELKKKGVLVLDRLGRVHFSAVSQLAGGQVLDPFSFSPPVIMSRLGGVSHVILNNKSYVHMAGVRGHGESVHTLVLCHRSQEATAEIRAVCESVMNVLRLTATQPYVLCGGACWQTCLSHYIRKKMPSLVASWKDLLECSPIHVKEVIKTFTTVLEITALTETKTTCDIHITDKPTGHHFIQPDDVNAQNISCQCGVVVYKGMSDMCYDYLGHAKLKEKVVGSEFRDSHGGDIDVTRSTVTDPFAPAVGSLKTSVGIGCMVLGIRNFVQDIN